MSSVVLPCIYMLCFGVFVCCVSVFILFDGIKLYWLFSVVITQIGYYFLSFLVSVIQWINQPLLLYDLTLQHAMYVIMKYTSPYGSNDKPIWQMEWCQMAYSNYSNEWDNSYWFAKIWWMNGFLKRMTFFIDCMVMLSRDLIIPKSLYERARERNDDDDDDDDGDGDDDSYSPLTTMLGLCGTYWATK